MGGRSKGLSYREYSCASIRSKRSDEVVATGVVGFGCGQCHPTSRSAAVPVVVAAAPVALVFAFVVVVAAAAAAAAAAAGVVEAVFESGSVAAAAAADASDFDAGAHPTQRLRPFF